MRKALTASAGCVLLSDQKPTCFGSALLVTLDNVADRTVSAPATDHSSVCPINFRRYGIGLPRLSRVTGNQGSIPEREPEKRLPHPRKAAGAQLTHSWHGEVVTKNNNSRLETRPWSWNEYTLKLLTSIYWRASLVPAAAVIPAPIAYTKVVAVKKLVVGSWSVSEWSIERLYCSAHSSLRLRV